MPSTIILDKDMLTKLYVGEDISIMKIAKKLGYSATCIYNNLLRPKIKENVSKCVDKVEEFISYGTVRKL